MNHGRDENWNLSGGSTQIDFKLVSSCYRSPTEKFLINTYESCTRKARITFLLFRFHPCQPFSKRHYHLKLILSRIKSNCPVFHCLNLSKQRPHQFRGCIRELLGPTCRRIFPVRHKATTLVRSFAFHALPILTSFSHHNRWNQSWLASHIREETTSDDIQFKSAPCSCLQASICRQSSKNEIRNVALAKLKVQVGILE